MTKVHTLENRAICPMCKGKKYVKVRGQKKDCVCQKTKLVTK